MEQLKKSCVDEQRNVWDAWGDEDDLGWLETNYDVGYDFREVWEALDNSITEEVAAAWFDYTGDTDLTGIEEAYCGQWISDAAFVQDLVTDSGYIPDTLASFIIIDWESMAQNIMTEYFESNGHYFKLAVE